MKNKQTNKQTPLLPFIKRLILRQCQFNHAADRVEGLEESLCVLGLTYVYCLFG